VLKDLLLQEYALGVCSCRPGGRDRALPLGITEPAPGAVLKLTCILDEGVDVSILKLGLFQNRRCPKKLFLQILCSFNYLIDFTDSKGECDTAANKLVFV